VKFPVFQRLVGANIRRARHLAGKTQEQVDGITLRYFQEVERGMRNPSLEVLFNLSQQFKVTVADLVDVEGARPNSKKLEDRTPSSPPRPGRKPRVSRKAD
jgi:transcriptional regulator with XRE-family HTH domain